MSKINFKVNYPFKAGLWCVHAFTYVCPRRKGTEDMNPIRIQCHRRRCLSVHLTIMSIPEPGVYQQGRTFPESWSESAESYYHIQEAKHHEIFITFIHLADTFIQSIQGANLY